MSEVRTPPIRLVDLEPRWIRVQGGEVYGIEYRCPCRDPQCAMGGRCVVPTKSNFTEDSTCADSRARGWDITGTGFEDVTLSPSIHHVGHWHGWLRNGELVSC